MNKSNVAFTGEQNAITNQEILVERNTLSFDQSVNAGDILLPGMYVSNDGSSEVELVSVNEDGLTVVINISKDPNKFMPVGLGLNTFKLTYKRK